MLQWSVWEADQCMCQHVQQTRTGFCPFCRNPARQFHAEPVLPLMVAGGSPLPFSAVTQAVTEGRAVINNLKRCYTKQLWKRFKSSCWSPVILLFMQKRWCFCWSVTSLRFRPTSGIFLPIKRFASSSWPFLHSADCRQVRLCRQAQPLGHCLLPSAAKANLCHRLSPTPLNWQLCMLKQAEETQG